MKKRYSLIASAIGAFMLVTGMLGPVQATQVKGDSALMFGGSFFHAQGACHETA
ncbi:MAG: hypothetical protein KJO60_02985 [Desulfofustis sp.]|nr:hypothetical protein [Desulfofustis sp.]